MAQRVLDPVDRGSEVLFGLIMVLTFTGSISVAEGGEGDVGSVLIGAVACNLAWGFVDAAMYLMSNLLTRARGHAMYQAVRQAAEPADAHRLIRDALPPVVAEDLTPAELESMRQRLKARAETSGAHRLTRADLAGALGVFLLVFLSTFPVVIPFLFLDNTQLALRVSNAIAIAMLFALGWMLGRYAGRSGWVTGLAMVALGVFLVGVTMALGG